MRSDVLLSQFTILNSLFILGFHVSDTVVPYDVGGERKKR
jgi:hypothetical protein